MKFKVGDTVKIKKGLNYKDTHSFIKAMEEYRGKVAKIVKINKDYPCYDLDIDGGAWYWTDDMLEPVSSKKYEVIIDGNIIIVKDDKGNEGIAECPFEDKFNLSTAISLAIERMRWNPNYNEYYWAIDFSQPDYVVNHKWVNDCTDNGFFKNGIVFKTKKEAIEVANKMLEVGK